MNILNSLFGQKPDYEALIEKGALLLDVRTKGEFAAGHALSAKNIPLNELERRMAALPKDKPVITVCASGMRSRAAAQILKQNGFTEVYNGGAWQNVNH